MSNNSNNYNIKKVESSLEINKDLDKKIRNNIIFSIASFLLAGVAFGIGDEILSSTSLQYLTAFGAIGISTANIRALKENLKLKSGQTPKDNKSTKGK